MIDWKQIEMRYVTGCATYRELARQYGVGLGAVKHQGRQYGWVEKRKDHMERIGQEILEKDKEQRVDRFIKLADAADGLLLRIRELTEGPEINPAAIKTLTEALKNIRDVQMVKSSADQLEQQMRIEKLRKEVSRPEQEDGGVKVELEQVREFVG